MGRALTLACAVLLSARVGFQVTGFRMVRSLALSAVVLALLAGPVLAENECVEPYAPTMPNGATATLDQVAEASREANKFMRESGVYQDCLLRDLAMQRADAHRRQKPFDEAIADTVARRVNANQREKVRVGTEFQATHNAFKAAHPEAGQ